MKNSRSLPLARRSRRGFSMVEMIGVLAIIAILAVVIVPRVFSTIASSRVTNAVSSVNALKSSVSEFAGKYGTIPLTANANQRIDDLLLTAGYLDSRLTLKLGTPPANPAIAGATWTYANGVWTAAGGASQATQSRIISVASNTAVPATGTNYRLNGTTDLPPGSRVISVVIPGVTGTDARELSVRIDGDSLSQATATTADTTGKVVYVVPTAAGVTTVYIYLAHQ